MSIYTIKILCGGTSVNFVMISPTSSEWMHYRTVFQSEQDTQVGFLLKILKALTRHHDVFVTVQ